MKTKLTIKRNTMATLDASELRNEIAKQSNVLAKDLAVKYGLSTREIAGIRRSITCEQKRSNTETSLSGQVIEFVKNEKKSKKKKHEIKETNTYSNSEGLNKQKARELMVSYVTNLGLTLSLPWIECAIEKMLLKSNPIHKFLGVERDKETYKAMRKFIRKNELPIEAYQGNISEKIYGTIPNTYANLILDYCGELPTIANELRYAIDNNIMQVNGIMAVTFAKPIRKVNSYFGQQIKSLGMVTTNLVEDKRCVSDRAVEAYFHKVCGFDYELVEIFNYQDSYPMTLVIVRRIR